MLAIIASPMLTRWAHLRMYVSHGIARCYCRSLFLTFCTVRIEINPFPAALPIIQEMKKKIIFQAHSITEDIRRPPSMITD